MKKYCVQGMLLLLLSVPALANMQPLKVGDHCPDLLLKNIINYPKQKAKLSDFKAKLIIIDFLATSCSSCIHLLPELDSLQHAFKAELQIIPVTYEKKEVLQAFLKTNKKAKGVSLPFVTEDTLLSSVFNHVFLPHEVWIKANGEVIAITIQDYITKENIAQVLAGKKVSWPVKKDILDFDYAEPLLQTKEPVSVPAFYAAVFPHLDGLDSKAGKLITKDGRSRLYYTNFSALHLYAMLMNSPLPLDVNRRIINTSDASRYEYDNAYGYRDVWEHNNALSMEVLADSTATADELKDKLRHALDEHLRVTTCIEKRKLKCLVLSATGGPGNTSAPTTARDISIEQGAKDNHVRNGTTADLVYELNLVQGMPPIRDATGGNQTIDLDLPSNLLDIESVNKALAASHLQLKEEEREIEVFILEEHSSQPKKTL